jgi:hypothetical protein
MKKIISIVVMIAMLAILSVTALAGADVLGVPENSVPLHVKLVDADVLSQAELDYAAIDWSAVPKHILAEEPQDSSVMTPYNTAGIVLPDPIRDELAAVDWSAVETDILRDPSTLWGDTAPMAQGFLPYKAASDGGGITTYAYTGYYFTGRTYLHFAFDGALSAGAGTLKIKLIDLDAEVGTADAINQAYIATVSSANPIDFRHTLGGMDASHRYYLEVRLEDTTDPQAALRLAFTLT